MNDTAARSVRFEYTNWRGETAERWATPSKMWWGKTDYHPEPQWLMTAFDHDKEAERDFALRDCRFVSGSEDTPDYTPIASFHFSMSKQDIDRHLDRHQEEVETEIKE